MRFRRYRQSDGRAAYYRLGAVIFRYLINLGRWQRLTSYGWEDRPRGEVARLTAV